MADRGPVVSNSGPLIVLAAVGQLDLIGSLYKSVLVPDAVFREVTQAGEGRPGAIELIQALWAVPSTVLPPPDPLLLKDLGQGEAEAITLAVRSSARLLLIDDRKARRIAQVAYGLHVKGAPGVLIAAKRAGLLGSVESVLTAMRRHGYHLAQSVIDRTLHEAGEK